MEAALTNRQRLVNAASLALLFLLALTAWHAGREFYGAVLSGTPLRSVTVEGVKIWQNSFIRTLTQYAYVLGGAVFLVGVIALIVRLALALRILEFLYVDSDDAGKRGFAGYMTNVLSIIVQLLFTYLMINALMGDVPRTYDGRLALFLLSCVLVVNGLWLFWVYLSGERGEKETLRGTWRAGLVSIVFAALLVIVQLYCAPVFGGGSDEVVLRSINAAIAGGFMVMLCAVDGYVQAQTCARKEKTSAARYSIAAVLAAVLLALALYLIGTALLSPAFWR
jgi:hypothetical protein